MSWTLDDATARYGIDRWGSGYFAINDAGHVCVRPGGADGPAVDLHDVVEGLRARDLTAPLVIRFSGIIAANSRT